MLLATAVAALPACTPDADSGAQRPADTTAGAVADTTAGIERAAADAVGFLRGTTPFEQLRLADSVTLHVSPAGGGGSRTLSRDALREREAWAVSSGARRVGFVPDAALTRLTTRAGRHFACREQQLAPLFPALAAMPHVGTRLEPDSSESCLQTWNATFVFDGREAGARIVAAVYDQWEW